MKKNSKIKNLMNLWKDKLKNTEMINMRKFKNLKKALN